MRGENFLTGQSTQGNLLGFYTTRWIEASNRDAAETACASLLKADPDLVRGFTPNSKAMIYFEEIEELAAPQIEPPGGFTFFEMEK